MDMEFIKMKDAYGQLYQIENALWSYISYKTEVSYGTHWFHIAPRKILKRPPAKTFDSLSFHEYERIYLRTYDVFQELPESFYHRLHLIYPIRNKIAHCRPLTRGEFEHLVDVCVHINLVLSVNKNC